MHDRPSARASKSLADASDRDRSYYAERAGTCTTSPSSSRDASEKSAQASNVSQPQLVAVLSHALTSSARRISSSTPARRVVAGRARTVSRGTQLCGAAEPGPQGRADWRNRGRRHPWRRIRRSRIIVTLSPRLGSASALREEHSSDGAAGLSLVPETTDKERFRAPLSPAG
jgi:hypothetical protein